MSVIVTSPLEETPWYAPRWIFDALLEDVQRAFPDDAELWNALDKAMALDGLLTYHLAPDLARRSLQSVKAIAVAAAEGPMGEMLKWSERMPAQDQVIFRSAMRKLVTYISEREPSVGGK